MNHLSIGDLTQTFQNRRRTVSMKSDLARLAQELATGQKSDQSTAVAGDFAPIVGFERALKSNSAYVTSITEAGLFASTVQASLELVQVISTGLGASMLNAGTLENPLLIQTTSADAVAKFSAVVSAFNTQVANRYTFSGAATDTPALADAATIISELQIVISTETTAAGVEAAVGVWFDSVGGGFETVGYTGSPASLTPFRLSDSQSASVNLTAADTKVRSILKGFALAALVGAGALNTDANERAELARSAGKMVLQADYGLAKLRAQVGTSEALIDGAVARNSAEKISLEIARTEITAVDPYRTATELEAVRQQLETLYTLTVRLSRLSLAELLR